MALVTREAAVVGMTISADVKDRRGRVLIPAGVVIGAKHLRGLKLWGVLSVNVDAPEGADAEGGAGAIAPESMNRARELAAEMFRLNREHRSDPMLRGILAQSVLRMARQPLNDLPSVCSFQTVDHVDDADGRGGSGQSVAVIPSLSEIVERTKTLASLPAVYQELMAVVNHPHSSSADVARVIGADPGLTARLLRIVNSAFYAFPSEVETVSRAITIVGTAQLCDLALATSVVQMFGDGLDDAVDMNMFWRHSVSCGVFARILARYRGVANEEAFFVTGLLHDVGRLVVLRQAPDLMSAALEEATGEGPPLSRAETEAMGYNHADASRALLESWGLPPSQSDAAGCHHRPQRSLRFPTEASAVHVADVIANAMCMGRSGERRVPPFEPKAWEQLGLEPGLLPDMIVEADIQVENLMRIFARD
jgi:HD-like signal output (HDOD) protein